jgi:hypothetical protein
MSSRADLRGRPLQIATGPTSKGGPYIATD